jgi:hypothetical protein
MTYTTGCLIDPKVTGEFCEQLTAGGKTVSFAAAKPDLKGYGVGRATFDWFAEVKLFGAPKPAWWQGPYGICVSEGTGRAVQSSLYWALAFCGLVGEPVEIANEPIYGARNRYRQMSDRSAGMYGADAARFIHDFGANARGVFASCDLSQPDPALANRLGQRHFGVPSDVLAAALKIEAVHQVTAAEEARDGVSAGFFGAYCADILFCHTSGPTYRDENGCCRPCESGDHCVELCGWFEDKKRDPIAVLRGSWGNTPTRGGPFRLYDGREIPPPEGVHGVYVDDFLRGLAGGECWLFSTPRNPWRKLGLKPSEIQ